MHSGSLWSSGGTRLATATFNAETPSGWQQVDFSSPVAVSANTTYIASYFAPLGHYSSEQNYFTAGLDRAPLHAPSSGVSGGNGVYVYGPFSTFPTSAYNASNYWVDVVFQTTLSTATSTPTPTVTSAPTSTATSTPTPVGGQPQTITFDGVPGENHALTGQYPTGLIDWGINGTWWVSPPWGPFSTKSVSFSGPSVINDSFTFLSPRRLIRLSAYNGRSSPGTVTLSCAGQPNVTTTILGGAVQVITTNWTSTCTTVTITSTNDWDINFDNLVIDGG
jgi:hypothetical protein